jgi:F-type H+-transporting ATPase subunit epsilon
VIAETVEAAEDIDINRAERARTRAEERIREARATHDASVDRARAEAALARATNRIKVAAMRRATAR